MPIMLSIATLLSCTTGKQPLLPFRSCTQEGVYMLFQLYTAANVYA